MSVYNPNIPAPTDFLSVSQQDIRNNFSQANTTFGVNHYTFADGTANNGKHAFAQFPEQSADPTTGANEGAVYTKELNTEAELVYRRESDGAIQQITGPSTAAQTGQSALVGGMIIKWGRSTVNPGNTTVTFATPFPNATFIVNLSPISNPDVRLQSTASILTTGFGVTNPGVVPISIHWIAIGN